MGDGRETTVGGGLGILKYATYLPTRGSKHWMVGRCGVSTPYVGATSFSHLPCVV
jgi:hypothetical protein